MKEVKEWFVDTVWGKVAMISWGDPRDPPVLLLHGYLDTAATFIPLVQQLPDTYYYVGFDNPGHGKSDPFPVGPLSTQVNYIEVINAVTKHLGWDKFMVLGHSMGFIAAIFYNEVFPNKITSMVSVDPLPPITNYFAIEDMPDWWYNFFYEAYYKDYKKNFDEPPTYTREQALKMLMASRHLTREQAEVLSTRGLVHVEGDRYRFARQFMMRLISQFPVLNDMLESVITRNPPRMLNLIAIHRSDRMGRQFSAHVMAELEKDGRHSTVLVDGEHDVHVMKPEILVDYIVDFFKDDELCKVKAKL